MVMLAPLSAAIAKQVVPMKAVAKNLRKTRFIFYPRKQTLSLTVRVLYPLKRSSYAERSDRTSTKRLRRQEQSSFRGVSGFGDESASRAMEMPENWFRAFFIGVQERVTSPALARVRTGLPVRFA